MIIKDVANNRTGYYGVMLNNGDDDRRDTPVVIFVWGKYDGTDNYITVTDLNGTKTHTYDSFAKAMLNAIHIAEQY